MQDTIESDFRQFGNPPRESTSAQLGITRFLPLNSHFVLTGNVQDLQIKASGEWAYAASLIDVLSDALVQAGYAEIVRYDPVLGFSNASALVGSPSDADAPLVRLGLTPVNGWAAGSLDLLGSVLQRHADLDRPPVALILDFVSRLIVRSDDLSPVEQNLFTRAFVLAQTVQARIALRASTA